MSPRQCECGQVFFISEPCQICQAFLALHEHLACGTSVKHWHCFFSQNMIVFVIYVTVYTLVFSQARQSVRCRMGIFSSVLLHWMIFFDVRKNSQLGRLSALRLWSLCRQSMNRCFSNVFCTEVKWYFLFGCGAFRVKVPITCCKHIPLPCCNDNVCMFHCQRLEPIKIDTFQSTGTWCCCQRLARNRFRTCCSARRLKYRINFSARNSQASNPQKPKQIAASKAIYNGLCISLS